MNEITTIIPHKCPACEGEGKKWYKLFRDSEKEPELKECHACKGCGILWGAGLPEQQAQYKTVYIPYPVYQPHPVYPTFQPYPYSPSYTIWESNTTAGLKYTETTQCGALGNTSLFINDVPSSANIC